MVNVSASAPTMATQSRGRRKRHAPTQSSAKSAPGQKNRPEDFVSTTSANGMKNHHQSRSFLSGRDSACHATQPAHDQTAPAKKKLSASSSCSYHTIIGKPAYSAVTGIT